MPIRLTQLAPSSIVSKQSSRDNRSRNAADRTSPAVSPFVRLLWQSTGSIHHEFLLVLNGWYQPNRGVPAPGERQLHPIGESEKF